MQLLVTAEQMQVFDRAAIDGLSLPGLILMENAGRAFTEILERRTGSLAGKKVTVVCGKGNNGGDGLVIARHLLNRQAQVEVILLSRPSEVRGDAGINATAVRKIAARKGGLLRLSGVGTTRRRVRAPDVVVDAVFGTGFAGEVSGAARRAIEWINTRGAFVASVDIPSGVNGSTGAAASAAVKADLTVTMGCAKIGHFLSPGRELAGEVVVADIGIPQFLLRPARHQVFRLERADVAAALPGRPPTAHKYSVGKVFVLGGSRNFTGAPTMASLAALRSGAGAVILGIPASLHAVLARKLTEVILLPLPETAEGTIAASALPDILERSAWADVVAVGPGLGRHQETDNVVRELLRSSATTAVVDADALTALAADLLLLSRRKGETVITPHAGELGRLTAQGADAIERRRVEAARESALRFKVTVLLKGSPTCTARPDGTVVLNPTGNPGMATIGSGDVLTGLIAGLTAQGMEPAAGAMAGAYVHGRGGDIAAGRLGQRSLLAMDILEAVPEALRELEQRERG